jgi:AmmeMemoRadiSam system protein B
LEKLFSFSDNNNLDYGSGVISYLLASDLNHLNFLNFNTSLKNLENNFEVGKSISHLIKKYEKNIAIIASGDMSHCLNKNSPGGYSAKGAKFDSQVKEIINKDEDIKENILAINENLIKKANECGLKTLMFVLGVIDEYSYQAKVLNYQDNLGIGYLSASFENLQEK